MQRVLMVCWRKFATVLEEVPVVGKTEFHKPTRSDRLAESLGHYRSCEGVLYFSGCRVDDNHQEVV